MPLRRSPAAGLSHPCAHPSPPRLLRAAEGRTRLWRARRADGRPNATPFATFDPAFAWNPEDDPYLGLLFEGLVAFDDSGRGAPRRARSLPAVSGDGRTYRFRLRPNLSYADGTPLVAADFAHGIRRLFRPGALRSPGAPQFAALAGRDGAGQRANAPPLGVEAPSKEELVLRLAWPDPHLLEKLAQPRYAIPVPESAGRDARAPRTALPRTRMARIGSRASDATHCCSAQSPLRARARRPAPAARAARLPGTRFACSRTAPRADIARPRERTRRSGLPARRSSSPSGSAARAASPLCTGTARRPCAGFSS
jgi:hypothetical protein